MSSKDPNFFTKLKMKDFCFIKDLGHGSYGVVSLVRVKDKYFALKQVNKEQVQRVDKVSNMFFERDVLQVATTPYMPNFHFTFQVSIFRATKFMSLIVASD